METFAALLRQIGQVFTWWVCVAPWEQCLRVRAGKRVEILRTGIHLRLPFVDVVFVQSVRLRIATLPTQTVTTKDRKPLTVGGTIGYSVKDIRLLHETLHHPEGTLTNLAAQAIAASAAELDVDDLTPGTLAFVATAKIKFEQYGISDATIRISDFAFVRSYRLIMDQRWSVADALNVEAKS